MSVTARSATCWPVAIEIMLDIEKIRELVDMMVANDLVEISLREGDKEVSLRRPNERVHPHLIGLPSIPGGPMSVNTNPQSIAAAALPVDGGKRSESREEPALIEIGAPMVGTFYASPDPNSPIFVQEGSVVRPGTVVCLLEAMKVFSEIKAEVSGTIQRVLVKNMEPVEYGQPLFLVRPS